MKRKYLIIVLILIALFTVSCEKDNNTKKESTTKQTTTEKESMVGYYSAFETVQYGKKYTGDAVKSEDITLLIRDDNTATLKWGQSEGKDYKIDGNKILALAGDEEGTITYKKGVVKVSLADGDYIKFRK